MKHFNWRVLSPNTMRAYETAANDFNKVTGIRVDRADVVSIATWQASMEARGLTRNTIRSRLSAVSIVSGVKVTLPKKTEAECPIFDEDQVRAFFRQVKDADRELMVSILLTGHQPKPQAHWLPSTHRTTQEITRKIKRYARLAGLNQDQVNMRTLIRTGRALTRKYDTPHLINHILPKPAQPTVEWKPLHGIGRRSNRLVKA
ncbi:MAG: site-specific integrase [Anaerolineae bacterium]|nr:site-specific integrase [Anaerolineae bacterium]